MDLKSIKEIAEKGKYDIALNECKKLLSEKTSDRNAVLRTKAYVHALSGDYAAAVQDRQAILQTPEATIGDYFLGADNATSAGDFKTAVAWLEKVLRLGDEQHEDWFQSAALLLLAYSQMQCGELRGAERTLRRLKKIEPDCSLPLPGIGMCSAKRLEEEIQNRRRQK